jgi:hypothetical protein
MESKEQYREKIEAQVKEWQAKIEELKAKAQQASAEAQLHYEKQMATLRPYIETAKQKLYELRTSSGSAFNEMQAGMETAWNDLKAAWDRAISQFKKS